MPLKGDLSLVPFLPDGLPDQREVSSYPPAFLHDVSALLQAENSGGSQLQSKTQFSSLKLVLTAFVTVVYN